MVDSIEKRWELGSQFLKTFTDSNYAFKKLKLITEAFISNEEDKKLLRENANIYDCKIQDYNVIEMNFYFGNAYETYRVSLDPLYLTIDQQDGHTKFSKRIAKIGTSDLKNFKQMDNGYN